MIQVKLNALSLIQRLLRKFQRKLIETRLSLFRKLQFTFLIDTRRLGEFEINYLHFSPIERKMIKKKDFQGLNQIGNFFYSQKLDINLAAKYFTLANSIQEKLIQDRLYNTKTRYLDELQIKKTYGFIGHLLGILKSEKLVPESEKKNIKCVNNNKIEFLNSHFYSKYVTKFVDFENLSIKNLIQNKKKLLLIDLGLGFKVKKQFIPFNHSAQALVQKIYDEQKLSAIFELNECDKHFFMELKKRMKISEERFIVCLHIRGSGFKLNEPFRQANIENYIYSIDWLIKNGAVVVRVGDKSMPAMPNKKHFIDLPHSNFSSSRVQTLFTASSKFFIGTSSGAYTLAHAFGVPVLQTNYLPWASMHLGKNDMFVPKMLSQKNKLLKFNQVTSTPTNIVFTDVNFNQLDLDVIENSSVEIFEAVEEFYLNSVLKGSSAKSKLQEKFQLMTAKNETLPGLKGIGIMCPISNSFVNRYESLLD